MRLNTYVSKRKSGYIYRQRVPASIKAVLGQGEFVVSLRTQSAQAANRRAFKVMASVNQLVENVYWVMEQFSHEEAKALAENWKKQALNQDFENRLAGTPTPVDDSIDDLKATLVRMDFTSKRKWITDAAQRSAPFLKPDSQPWRRAGYYLLQSKIEYLRELEERSRQPQAPMQFYPVEPIASHDCASKPVELNKPRLSDMLSGWEKDGRRPQATLMDWRTAIRRFIELKGDLHVDQIIKADVRDYKSALMKLPRRIHGSDRRLPLPKLVDKFSNKEVARLHPKTINTQIAALRSVLNWGIKNGYLDKNPADGISVPMPKVPSQARIPYSNEDLQLIFEQSPIYTKNERPTAGAGEASYWIPLFALYTGARLEELGQLLIGDVRCEENIWYLDLNTDGANKTLKTASSPRRIPLHQKLIETGFLKYRDHILRMKHTHLFPRLQHDKEKCTRMYSKWVNGYFRRVCGITDSRKVFHSFRHTFKDACRDAGIARDIHDALTGHADSAVSSRYGLGFSLKVLNEEVQKIGYSIKITQWHQ